MSAFADGSNSPFHMTSDSEQYESVDFRLLICHNSFFAHHKASCIIRVTYEIGL
jgi:hypothetical protein